MTSATSIKNAKSNLTTFFDTGVIEKFSKGEIIVHGSEAPAGVYSIKSGYVKAYFISPLGHQNIFIIYGRGEVLPLSWALGGSQTSGIFYEAMSDVTLQRVDKAELRSAMNEDQTLTDYIMQQLVATFAIYTHRVRNLSFRLPRERVIVCLLDLNERFGREHKETSIIYAPVTHQDIADSTNMTRETATRVLQQLFKDDLIGRNSRQFIIKNEALLNEEVT